MYEFKKIGKVVTSKFVGTGPSSYKKIIYRAAVSQRLRNTALDHLKPEDGKGYNETSVRTVYHR
jgi:hypothetical protein